MECSDPSAECVSDDVALGVCVGDLAEGLGIAPSTVSHHLKELRLAGLIFMERRGRNIRCRLNTDALAVLASVLAVPQRAAA